MSTEIEILKEIDGFSFESAANSVRQAAANAGMHIVHWELAREWNPTIKEDEDYLSGNLSEVSLEMLSLNAEKDIDTRQLGFVLEKPYKYSYDSCTWLINKANYFQAFYLEYLYNEHDYEFAFQFLSHYFRLKENARDYVWVNSTEWAYSAKEILWLSTQPYRPEWHYKKLVPGADRSDGI